MSQPECRRRTSSETDRESAREARDAANTATGSPRAAASSLARVGDGVEGRPRERRVRGLQARRRQRESETAGRGEGARAPFSVGPKQPVGGGEAGPAGAGTRRVPAGARRKVEYRSTAEGPNEARSGGCYSPGSVSEASARRPSPHASTATRQRMRGAILSSFRAFPVPGSPVSSTRRTNTGRVGPARSSAGGLPVVRARRLEPFLHRNEIAGTTGPASAGRSASLI